MLAAEYASGRESSSYSGWTLQRVVLRPYRRSPGSGRAVFEPPTDVYETAEQVVVRMEIAGLTPDQIEVALNSTGEVLTIAGRREDPAAGHPRKYYSMEIECGEFFRQIQLPQPIDAEAVAASYADGFLEVVMPKRTPAPRRRRSVPIE